MCYLTRTTRVLPTTRSVARRCPPESMDGYHDVGRHSSQSDRGEILKRVVGNFRVKAGIDRMAPTHRSDGVAVRQCSGSGAHTKVAASAPMVLDIELLAEALRKSLCDQSREHVSRSARREWHDHAHRPRWISLRPSQERQGRKSDASRGQMQKRSTRNSHWGLSIVRKRIFSTRKSRRRFGRAARPRRRPDTKSIAAKSHEALGHFSCGRHSYIQL